MYVKNATTISSGTIITKSINAIGITIVTPIVTMIVIIRRPRGVLDPGGSLLGY